MGDFVISAVSTKMLNYEDSPVYTLAELELFRASRKIVGYPEGKGDGLLCPGGSISVISTLNVAKIYKFPELRTTGMSELSKKLVFYISVNAHYCYTKGSVLQGRIFYISHSL